MFDFTRYDPHSTYGDLVALDRTDPTAMFNVVGSAAPILLVEGRLTAGWTDEQICGWNVLGLAGREQTIAAIRAIWITLPRPSEAFSAALRRSTPLAPTVVVDRERARS